MIAIAGRPEVHGIVGLPFDVRQAACGGLELDHEVFMYVLVDQIGLGSRIYEALRTALGELKAVHAPR